MWGFLAGGLAKTTKNELADQRRREGATNALSDAELGPQAVSNVVPRWLATFSGVCLGVMLLGIVAQALRLQSHRASADEATVGMLWGAALCGLPGIALAIAAWRGFQRNALIRKTEGERARA